MNPVLVDVEWNHHKKEASSYKGGDAYCLRRENSKENNSQ